MIVKDSRGNLAPLFYFHIEFTPTFQIINIKYYTAATTHLLQDDSNTPFEIKDIELLMLLQLNASATFSIHRCNICNMTHS